MPSQTKADGKKEQNAPSESEELIDLDMDDTIALRRRTLERIRDVFVRGWQFTKITVREAIADQVPLKSMGLTFATLLSLIPVLAISFSLFRLFGGGEWLSDTLRPLILENLAPGTGPRVAEKAQELIDSAGSATLGGLGVLLLVLAVYGIFTGIESAINGIWDTRSRAGSLQRLPLYWGMVTILPILVVASLAVSTYLQAVPIISEAVQSVDKGEAIINRLLSMLMIFASFFLLYKFVPATKVKMKAAATGAIVAGLLYELFKAIFIIYTADLVQYDVVYGSLAIFPLMLIWFNLSWILVLGGVEVSFVAQHYTALKHKPKHVKLSRNQKNAVAYLLLKDVTNAFQAERDEVVLEEWAKQWEVPFALANEIADRLKLGGIVERAEKGYTAILLTRSPEKISIEDIEALLSLETSNEWNWPEEETWKWLQTWMKKREAASIRASSVKNLADLVESLGDPQKTSNGNKKGKR